MPEASYVIVGSSHAALEALRAIRQVDPDGTMAMLTRDRHLPYSPTLLPYVVSGRVPAERACLRDAAFFAASFCRFVADAPAVALDAEARTVTLANGEAWRYGKLLIATGAVPARPPIRGLDGVRSHVLRSLDDAMALREAVGGARRAVVLGAGLVGLHAAELLAESGVAVSVVEIASHVLSGYFAATASARIEEEFVAHGVTLLLGRRVAAVAERDGAVHVTLDAGQPIEADLLLVATGTRPAAAWLSGAGIAIDQGVLVDDRMRTSLEGVWAAGDVAQARDFHTGRPALNGIVPTAVEQGRVAGRDMAGDGHAAAYPGALRINTYRFFGRVALSVGEANAIDGGEIAEHEGRFYRRLVLADGRLVGYASIDEPFDVGLMGELIRRRVFLRDCKEAFLSRPLETGRRLMSEAWR